MNALLLTAALAAGHPPAPVPPVVYPPPAVPGFRPPAFAPGRPLTVEQFARSFRPCPGHHEVWLVHPRTGAPVFVCFDLPFSHRRPEIDWDRNHIEFDYGRREVEIRFLRNGRVDVRADD